MIKKMLVISIYSVMFASNWGYDGDTSPEFWGDLNKSYELCKTGTKQSPINLSEILHYDSFQDLNFTYQDIVLNELSVVDNGHTIQVNYKTHDSYLIFKNKKYYLTQFHFHSPSEHTIDNIRFPLGIHLVHKADDGSLAVVGLLGKEGKNNLALDKIFDNLDMNEVLDSARLPLHISNKLNAKELFPKKQSYFAYEGSLTTPPCSEGVNWIIFDEQIELSIEQIKQFQKHYYGNYRHTQNLNDRNISKKH